MIRTLFYSKAIMQASQQSDKTRFLLRASRRQRVVAGLILLATLALFVLLWLAANDKIDIGLLLGPCGFKQEYSLPCPTCGITTSAIAFAQGKIFTAFYIQPTGALLCSLLILTAFLAFLISIFGVYFKLLKRFFTEVKLKHIILALLIIIASAWMVTLARALVLNSQG